MPPTVHTLDQLMASSNPIYEPQRQIYNQQMGQATDLGQQQEQGLYNTQKQAFGDISQMASNKGMLFSGFTPDQQAKYNATKFMPALVDLRGKVQDNISKLQSALVGLDTEQRKQAMDQQGNEQNQLNQYNQQQQQQEFQRQQAQLQYQHELALANSKQQAAQPTAAQQLRSDASALYSKLATAAGNDGYISPATYAAGLQLWQSAGYTQKDFDALFSGLRNPNNSHYRLASGWGA
jgi:hypothetical protein